MDDDTRTQVGVVLPTRQDQWGEDADARSLVDFAVRAERLGYHSVWAGDTLLNPVPEPLTLLSALAARTERVTLGTAALLPAFRGPVLAARILATLDQLCGGRLTLTVGAGFPGRSEVEYALSGTPWRRRFARLDETVCLWRRLWAADGPVSFQGEELRVEGVPAGPAPHRVGGPPVWLAGVTPSALDRTGRRYDGWLPYPPDAAEYAAGLAAVERAAGEAGREPGAVTPALFATVLIIEDGSSARSALDAYCRFTYGMPVEVVETLQVLVAGTPGEVAERLAQFTAAGARHLVCRLAALGLDAQRGQLERLAALLLD
ncbi:hypothetical protein ACZ90_52555 [Streptomyces albus subsp. albus]|nr:hypothetical protein ACZ90_52555 [Streptomyces albus subsp. albus]